MAGRTSAATTPPWGPLAGRHLLAAPCRHLPAQIAMVLMQVAHVLPVVAHVPPEIALVLAPVLQVAIEVAAIALQILPGILDCAWIPRAVRGA